MEYEHIIHPFEPIYSKDSKILILGSLPSVKSREQNFYYGHPQNRFWRVVSSILQEPLPNTIEEKRDMLLRHNIAIWDVIYSCDIKGSSDSSIKNVVPTDIASLVKKTQIIKIYCNGKTSGKLFQKYQESKVGIPAVVLPSTSPANAAFSLERLIQEWNQCIQ
ncbi:MAG: DNA-deoxyinosine glycosylase [Lachnospiraceae bacterium]